LACLIVLIAILLIFPVQLMAADRLACASYPVWIFARFLTQGTDRFQAELITNPATGCPHEFAPAARDLERLTKTRFLVKNGLDLESYLPQALMVAPKDIKVIDASDAVPTLSQVWGRVDLEGEPAKRSGGKLPSMLPNPHIFLSPKNAKIMVANIADALIELDPQNQEHYRERLAQWSSDMDRLSDAIADFQNTRRGYKVMTSHGFFDYLAQDLGLTVLADLSPSEEAPPSAARLDLLRKIITSEKINAILLDPHADPSAAQTLGAELKVPGAVIDTVASGPSDPPLDYYQLVLKEDLELLSSLFPPNYKAPDQTDSGGQ
jgi:ABC-type Zn uptake system ZnuABC Zn-binding protein ZnuA